MPILPATAWPAVVLPFEAVGAWQGARAPTDGRVRPRPPDLPGSAPVTDFDLACFAFDQPIPVGGGADGFAVPSDPVAPQPFELIDLGGDHLALVGFAEDLEDGLGGRIEDGAAVVAGTLDLRASGRLVAFDPSLTGDEALADPSRHRVHRMTPGRYVVRVHDEVGRYLFVLLHPEPPRA